MTSISTSTPPSNLLTSSTADASETGPATQANVATPNDTVGDLAAPKLTLTQGADRMLALAGTPRAAIGSTAGETIPEISIVFDDNELPDGVSLNDLASAQFVFDSNTGTVTPTLTFNVRSDPNQGGYSFAGGAAGFGSTKTVTVTTSPQTTTQTKINATAKMTLFGRGVTATVAITVTHSSGGRTTTTTTANGGGIEKPPEKSGSGTPAKSPKTGAK